ncbi:hypothetical protein COV16_00735 [Candidatus Woesearchaeota archaeon CG10_big_fil_rev_8_21_14_0_10_34_8]|nr:MAG: hypothetical protein COV16_00735 [Candidatus Woesearchaeota archaeon CG10_big_fil_rev_8_21_14_0_10_34_8]
MKVSIIVVTLNEEKNILSCLQSLLKQEYNHDYEIIILDGGSKDNTTEIVQKFAKKNKFIKLVAKEKGTITECRNLGIKNAEYEYVAFTDADCAVPEDWLTRLANGFKRYAAGNPRLAGVGGANIPPVNPVSFQKAIGIAFNSLLGSLGSIQAKQMKKDKKIFSISCTNSLYKKSILKSVGMFSEDLGNQGEDWDMGAKLLKNKYEVYGLHDSYVWHNFRATPITFWKNMVFYGDGRMRLTRRHPDIVKKRYILPLFFIPLFMLSLILFMFTNNSLSLLPYLYFPFILFYSINISIKQKQAKMSLLVTYAFLIQHFGYAYGELNGLRWILK